MKRKYPIFFAFIVSSLLLSSGCMTIQQDALSSASPAAKETSSLSDQDTITSQESAGACTSEQTASQASYEITYSVCNLFRDSIGTVWGQTIVEITNTGTQNLYLASGSYDLEDSSGNLVAAQSYVSLYPDVLQPGEKGYLYEETTFERLDPDSQYTVLPHLSIEPARISCVRYDISELTLYPDDLWNIKSMGRVTNTATQNGSLVYVVAVLYDENMVPLGIMSNILNEVPAGESIGFELLSTALPPEITLELIADITVYAYPLQMQF